MLKRARLLCYLVLCVSRAVLSAVLGAWSVRCVGRSIGLIVGVSCLLCSSAVPGVWSFLRVTHNMTTIVGDVPSMPALTVILMLSGIRP